LMLMFYYSNKSVLYLLIKSVMFTMIS